MEPLKILFASSEVEPFVKTGGLADVAGSLPRALRKNGADVRVVMPKYAQIPERYLERMTFLGQVEVDLVWRRQYCGIFHLQENGVDCYFLDNQYYFHRDWLYGQPDDGERFAFFSRAILAILPRIGFQPDILHLNDWQTGMTPVFLDAHFRWGRGNGFYRNMRTVFTIHNLRYQGVFPREMMDSVLGLDWSWFHPGGVAHEGCVNFMKGALNQSTRVTTVSRTYAEEIRTPFFGEGLEGTINHRAADLRGIVNGIDYDLNNPETDERLYAPFSAVNPSGKAVNKESLQRQHHLPARAEVPLIGIISRFVDQKGFDLVAHVLEELLLEDVQLIVLGTGDRKYEELFRWAHHAHPGKVSAHIRYDGVLAQRIYAACDLFLMPSLFEPCGLSQIFSMRYGTVPIVRETGGLKDTVIPYNTRTGEGTGFTFANYNAHEMLEAIRRSMDVFHDGPSWDKLVKACMSQDFSWDHAAREYEALYREMMDTFPDVMMNPIVKKAPAKPDETKTAKKTKTEKTASVGTETKPRAMTRTSVSTKSEGPARQGKGKSTSATVGSRKPSGTGVKGTALKNRKKEGKKALDREWAKDVETEM